MGILPVWLLACAPESRPRSGVWSINKRYGRHDYNYNKELQRNYEMMKKIAPEDRLENNVEEKKDEV